MGKIADFLDMGSYGGFVWPSYALMVVLLVWLAIQSLRWLRAEERAVRGLEADAPHRRAAGAGRGTGSADAEGGR